jgi:hypothetical protein
MGRVDDGQTNSVLFDLSVWPSSGVQSSVRHITSTSTIDYCPVAVDTYVYGLW